MLGVGGAEDVLALELLVDLVRLGHLHGGHDLVRLFRQKSDFGPGSDLLILRHRDRNGPEDAVGHLHVFADALPVVVAHEAFERREAADTQHDEVAGLARRHLQLRQGLGLLQFLLLLLAFEKKNLQRLAAVRRYQFFTHEFCGSCSWRSRLQFRRASPDLLRYSQCETTKTDPRLSSPSPLGTDRYFFHNTGLGNLRGQVASQPNEGAHDTGCPLGCQDGYRGKIHKLRRGSADP